VAISHITVTDGVVIQRHRDFSRKKILGGPITRRGFPDFNTLINQAVLPINLPQ